MEWPIYSSKFLFGAIFPWNMEYMYNKSSLSRLCGNKEDDIIIMFVTLDTAALTLNQQKGRMARHITEILNWTDSSHSFFWTANMTVYVFHSMDISKTIGVT